MKCSNLQFGNTFANHMSLQDLPGRIHCDADLSLEIPRGRRCEADRNVNITTWLNVQRVISFTEWRGHGREMQLKPKIRVFEHQSTHIRSRQIFNAGKPVHSRRETFILACHIKSSKKIDPGYSANRMVAQF